MRRLVPVFSAFILAALALSPAFAQTADEIKQEIEGHNAQIAELNKEIAAYEKQLDDIGAKKQTLQNTLSQLDVQRKKIAASISLTKNKVSALQLEIRELSRGIESTEISIQKDKAGLGEALRRLDEAETKTILESVLSPEGLSAVWSDMEANRVLQDAVRDDIAELSAEKKSLAETKTATEAKRAELVRQQNNLIAEQGSLDVTRRAQSELLAQTRSQEANFQAILEQKKAQQAAFEAALGDLQTRLQVALDPSKIPTAGKGILRWPLDNVKVTQYFGNTAFARAGGYSGKGHNGIDLRAAVGTPLKAALTGTVAGTGNTDTVRGCYSYGRWVLVRHANGLSTLYAHLSQINVSAGESVATGQLIGYSGATGYATGPHLHFGVFVTSATQIIKLGEATNKKTACSNATMPVVSPLSGYLNPIDYL